jgi:integrase
VIQKPLHASHLSRWIFPIDVTHYDRRPELSEMERLALVQVLGHSLGKRKTQLSYEARQMLGRLLLPLDDILSQLLAIRTEYCTFPIQIMLSGMNEYALPYWAWSEVQWVRLLTSTFQHFCQQHVQGSVTEIRRQLVIFAYILGPQTDFCLAFFGEQTFPRSVATLLFGQQQLEGATTRIGTILSSWGYEVQTPRCRKLLVNALAEVFLVNRNPWLENVSFELLQALREKTMPHKRPILERISKALVQLEILETSLPSVREMSKVSPSQMETTGVAPQWVEWCLQWHHFSPLEPQTKRSYLLKLFRTGRWLAQMYPQVTTPHQWDSWLAAEFVATVDQMKEGDFSLPDVVEEQKLSGNPLAAVTKSGFLVVMRTFFRDVQEEPHNVPRRFDPLRAFRTPGAIQRQIGPNPRDLDPFLWAKLVHAAVELTEEDLPQSGRGGRGMLQYPFELVQAIAVVWVYSGLRSDEIARLTVGCIRWQREDVTVPETGEILPREAVCFLTVPVNKTTSTFQKPVNPILGHRINEWERVRAPNQPPQRDRKTGARVEYLFSHRGHVIGQQYLNARLIPCLCEKAGIPKEDERGAITSHRARATLATLLYNAPDGLSIFDLKHWLGHKDVSSTQHYARVKPTKLAAAYANAERNSRLVEALVDTKADVNREVKVYYVLGDHGLCGNPDWASCLYRMSCIKCPFFVPKERVQLIAASKTVKRFMEVVELTDEELLAVQDDYSKLEEAVKRTEYLPAPTLLRRRAKGTKNRGIPLTVLNTPHPTEEDHHATSY